MGVTEAFIVIYGPVWVNNYSPPEHSTKWMGLLHLCTVLGVVFGYLVAGVTINFFSNFLSWRFAVQLQGIAQIPVALYFFFENEQYINVDMSAVNPDENNDADTVNSSFNAPGSLKPSDRFPNETPKSNNRNSIKISNEQINNSSQRQGKLSKFKKKDTRIDTVETSNLSRYCAQTRVVLCNTLYVTVTMGLCSMYFIVTGIQFWMTSYLIDILNCNPVQVVFVFSSVSITAPILGVIVGGTFADKYGGYRGKNTLKALKLCSAFGVVAFVFAFPIGFLYSLTYIIVLLWTFLFFGAAIIPVGTGIMVSSVRR
jgi:MFS family permease